MNAKKSLKKFVFPPLLIGAGLAFVLQALAKPASTKPARKSDSYEAIDAYVDEQMQRLNIPGVALAVVEGDQIVHQRGFGRARPDGERPSPQTPFFIGSLTKSMTALATMQLVEAGKIELDAPVQRYLLWFRVADPLASAKMTVRHLLNQTSGLPLLPSWELLSDFDDRPDAAERQARALAAIRLSRAPGEGFEYSNLNYNLLGLIVEAASGESFPAYIQNHIFGPLRMFHSYTTKMAAKRDGLAVGHQSWFGFPVAVPDLPVPSGSLSSGQLICSAEDMGRYLMAHLNEGRCGEAQILSPEGIAELHRPAVDASSMGATEQYGMGWYIEEQGPSRLVWHTGMVPNFYAYMALLPEQKKGVILLANINHFTMQLTLTEVGTGLAALLAGKQPAPIEFGAIPWVQRGMLLIPLLQIAGVAATLRSVRRWRQEPELRPTRRRMWGRHILLPLIPNTLAALTLVPVLSKLRGFIRLFAPDFSLIGLICGSFALVWSVVRTKLVLKAGGKTTLSESRVVSLPASLEARLL